MKVAMHVTTWICAAWVLCACGSSEQAQTAQRPGNDAVSARPMDAGRAAALMDLVLADVEVTVEHDGPSDAPLVVAAFSNYPPSGAPVALQRIKQPTFPIQVTLRDLEVGTWHIVALLDYAPPSPTLPGDEDLLAQGDVITVSDDSAQQAKVILTGGTK